MSFFRKDDDTKNESAELSWELVGDEIRIYVVVQHRAIDKRQMKLHTDIDLENRLVRVLYSVHSSGRRYHHDSIVRGFCVLPLAKLKGLDPNSCDWIVQKA